MSSDPFGCVSVVFSNRFFSTKFVKCSRACRVLHILFIFSSHETERLSLSECYSLHVYFVFPCIGDMVRVSA